MSELRDSMIRQRASAETATIRAVRPEDRERIVAAFRSLPPRSVYQRFFHAKRTLSDRELRLVTEPDGERRVVLVATARDGSQEAVVALGQYVRDGASADLAFVVVDDYQGRGIASRMLRQLAEIARRHGVAQFVADVLADNAAMLRVFRRSELPIRESEEDGVVHLTLALGDRRRVALAAWRPVSKPPHGGSMKRVLAALAMLAVLVPTASAADPEALARTKQCFSCHALDRDTRAPSFQLLAQNYGGIPNADYILERRVRLGGVGHWGAEAMPGAGPRPPVTEAEAKELVAWILGMK